MEISNAVNLLTWIVASKAAHTLPWTIAIVGLLAPAITPVTASMKGVEVIIFPQNSTPPAEGFEMMILWLEGIGEVGLELLIRRGASGGGVSL